MGFSTSTSILAMKHKVLRALMLLSAMLLLPSALFAQGKYAYALWTEGNSTLTFLYTDNEYQVGKSRGGYQITKLWSGDEVLATPTDAAPGWTTIRTKIRTVEFDPSFADARPTSIAYWFDNSENASTAAGTLTTLKGIEYLNTSEVTSMNRSFFRCAGLKALDLGTFNTSKVTDMSYMFMGCTSLTTLDLSGFQTGSVKDLNNMFAYCSGLVSLNVSGFKTGNVTDMGSMFYGCKNLEKLDVSKFDTKSVTTFANMFYGCYSLVGGNGTRFNSSYCDDLYANIDYSFNPGYLTSLWMGDAEIYLSSTRYTYDSKAKTPGVSVYIGEDKLDPGDDSSVSYSGNVNVGTAYVTITGAGIYEGTATATYKITQASNKAVAKKTTVKKTLKAKSLKKKALTVALPKVTTKFGKAKWTVAKKDKKKVLSLNAKTGKIKVKKGAKKGTYTIKVKAKVAKTKNYKAAATKVVTVKVKVK